MKNISKLSLAILAVTAGSQAWATGACPGAFADITAEYPGTVTSGFTAVCEVNGGATSNDVAHIDGSHPDVGAITAGAVTLESGYLWVLDGKVNVCDNTQRAAIDAQLDNATYLVPSPDVNTVTLEIQPGTTIVGDSDTSRASNDFGLDYLVINRGCDIDAVGMDASGNINPIRMTSVQDIDTSDTGDRGQWGGLYVNGLSPTNNLCDEDGETAAPGEFCIVNGEAETGSHGGGDTTDNSGTIQYLTVSYAGFQYDPESELNGIALQSVGSGTTVSHIQVNENADDGIELFGGDVNVSNVVLTNNNDDGFDLTDGWTGSAQYILVYNPDAGSNNRAFENNGGGGNPLSDGTVANITIISESTIVGDIEIMRSREGNNMHYANVVAVRPAGMVGECLDEDATSTWSAHYCDADTLGTAPGASAYTASFNGYINGFNELILAPSTNALVTSDPFLETTDFVGAVRDCDSDWTEGWVIPGTLPAVNAAECVDETAVPVMGWAGIAAMFAGLSGIAAVMRRRVR